MRRALVLALALAGCEMREDARELMALGGVCSWSPWQPAATAEDLALLERGQCFVVIAPQGARFVEGDLPCDRVETEGSTCAVLSPDRPVPMEWWDRSAPSEAARVVFASGADCRCE